MINLDLLKEFLLWVLTVGSGVLAYALINNVKGLAALEPVTKRRVAVLLSGAFALLAWLGMVGAGYVTRPATVLAWIESVFAVVAIPFGISQIIHGERDL